MRYLCLDIINNKCMQQNDLTYDAAMKRLEALTAEMESGQVPIEQLADKLKEAQRILAFCREQLTKADAEVKKLINPQES